MSEQVREWMWDVFHCRQLTISWLNQRTMLALCVFFHGSEEMAKRWRRRN